MIEDKVRAIIEKKVLDLGVNIDSIIYEKEGNNNFLRIIICLFNRFFYL